MAIVMANLQLLPVPGFKVLVLKTIKALLPREMGIPQQPLAPCDLAVVDLLLTEGIEELAGAPACRTERCALPIRLNLLSKRLPVAATVGEFQLFEHGVSSPMSWRVLLGVGEDAAGGPQLKAPGEGHPPGGFSGRGQRRGGVEIGPGDVCRLFTRARSPAPGWCGAAGADHNGADIDSTPPGPCWVLCHTTLISRAVR
jgi:hypothetical protein